MFFNVLWFVLSLIFTKIIIIIIILMKIIFIFSCSEMFLIGYTAVFSVVTQRLEELCVSDDTKNGRVVH